MSTEGITRELGSPTQFGDASLVFVDIGAEIHEQHPVHYRSVGLVPKLPQTKY